MSLEEAINFLTSPNSCKLHNELYRNRFGYI